MSDDREFDDALDGEALDDEGLDDVDLDDESLAELRDFRIEPDPGLQGRVHREINRRDLVAHGLEFSFSVFLSTCWDHLRTAIEAWPLSAPATTPDKEDPDHGQ